MKLEDVKKWHDVYKTHWWLPDVFEADICQEPLFPIYLAGLLKNIEDHRMVVRLNTDFPQLKAAVRVADYTKKIELTKEERAAIGKEELARRAKLALRAPAEYEPPSESVMEHTKLIDDAALAYLMIKEGVVYDPEKRFVFEPDSAIKKLTLLPPQPINALIDAYVYHIGNQCCIQRVAHNGETGAKFQIYPDLSDAKVKPVSLPKLLEMADINVLSQDEIESLFQVVESYAFASNDIAQQELAEAFEHPAFHKLCECMNQDLEHAKAQILTVQTMLPYKDIKDVLSSGSSLGINTGEVVSLVYARLNPVVDESVVDTLSP